MSCRSVSSLDAAARYFRRSIIVYDSLHGCITINEYCFSPSLFTPKNLRFEPASKLRVCLIPPPSFFSFAKVFVARALRLLRRHNFLGYSNKPRRPPDTACGGVHVDHHAAVLRTRLQGTSGRVSPLLAARFGIAVRLYWLILLICSHSGVFREIEFPYFGEVMDART